MFRLFISWYFSPLEHVPPPTNVSCREFHGLVKVDLVPRLCGTKILVCGRHEGLHADKELFAL